ncbi:MAG: hypothetical protein ACOCUL_01665, partial [Bacteroidota bacterium]
LKFSPITEVNTYLSKNYCELFVNGKYNVPLIICVPEKGKSAVWLAINLLTNFFLQDYIDNNLNQNEHNDEDLKYEVGDIIEVFGCKCEIARISKKSTTLRFSCGNSKPVSLKTRRLFEKIKNQKLSTLIDFEENIKNRKENRNAISNILEPNEPIFIEPETLKSSILLISGRGSTRKLKNLLNETIIFDEKLKDVFSNNLIIQENLDRIKTIAENDYERKLEIFISYLEKTLNNKEEFNPLIVKTLQRFLTDIKINGITKKSDSDFENIVDLYKNDIEILEFLKMPDYYPGIKPEEITEIKAVILNDISQLETYTNTINFILEKKIPVIVVSDRYIDQSSQLYFYNDLFNRNPDYFRINWNKEKISGLFNNLNESGIFLDKFEWDICKSFSQQKILIETFEEENLEALIKEVRIQIQQNPQYEILRKIHLKYLEAAYAIVKNSRETCQNTQFLLERFCEYFSNVEEFIAEEVGEKIQHLVESIKTFNGNSKKTAWEGKIFSQKIIKDDREIIIPNFEKEEMVINYFEENLLFTGFPHDEYWGRFLYQAVCKYFIKNLKVNCWPIESDIVYYYLKKRIRAGYFSELLPDELGFPKNFLLNDDDFILAEIEDTLIRIYPEVSYENSRPTIQEFDEGSIELPEFIRGELGILPGQSYSNPVLCNILFFDDDSYLYLPTPESGLKSKIMIGLFDERSKKFSVDDLTADEISQGSYFFDIDFYVDLKTVLLLSGYKNDEADSMTEKLFLWKSILNDLFSKNNNDINNLTDFLKNTKKEYPQDLKGASPELQNIRNWLFHNEFLAPLYDNIKLILWAGNVKDEKIAMEIHNLRNGIKGKLTSLSHSVKDYVRRKFEDGDRINERVFVYENNNVQIKGEIKRIIGIDRNNLSMDYHKTRKVICD